MQTKNAENIHSYSFNNETPRPISIAQMTSRKIYNGHQKFGRAIPKIPLFQKSSTVHFLVIESGRICMAIVGEDWGHFTSFGMEGCPAIHLPPGSLGGGMVPNIKEGRKESNTIEGRGWAG
ncbi:hypothetical protein CEXT_204641 [Caerostris extrusa]|uniref:Uncharacterized protein n=1 Tax=Caerostris extrusa TaxID=172846 RepID=A0AAV4MQQ1_CAEEX|nr:hypothetical protein CEXT_204641 [Caerostris extrusa]